MRGGGGVFCGVRYSVVGVWCVKLDGLFTTDYQFPE